MSDLVERARKLDGGTGSLIDLMLDEIESQAAEIERLTAELVGANNSFGSQTANWPGLAERIETLKRLSNDRWQDNERLTAENKQFRAALEEIEENALSEFEDGWCGDLAREALAALKETTK